MKKAEKELHPNRKIRFYWCFICHKYQPYGDWIGENKKLKLIVKILYCAICDTVLNLLKWPKHKDVYYRDLKKKDVRITQRTK